MLRGLAFGEEGVVSLSVGLLVAARRSGGGRCLGDWVRWRERDKLFSDVKGTY